MAGMDLNPYNLNNKNRDDTRGEEAVRAFSNYYANQNRIDVIEETDEEKEKQNIRNKYFGAYGFKSTDPKNMDLNTPKKEENKKDYSIYFVGAAIVILVIILIAIFL